MRARFDEANNIVWARKLEEAGVNVVYGLVSYKIHSKVCLVVRREGHGLRRYVHLATGNYNAQTARFYTDLSFLTCRGDFGEDATSLFNLLTGICQFQPMRKLLVAPFDLHARVRALIEREAGHARRGLPARIVARMNSLVDVDVIRALYRASQAGVKVELIVRGICCLRPGVKGLSANITVRSVVDRFLEHSRVWGFENACQPQVFLSSADWMPRNFHRRIEVAFPIEDGVLADRVMNSILAATLADNVKARRLQPDGSWHRVRAASLETARRSQFQFIAQALADEPEQQRRKRRTARYPVVKLAPRPAALAGPRARTAKGAGR